MQTENGPDSLDRIVSYEYQLQAAYQVSTGNIISSLRKNSRLDWHDPFEQLCMVEQTLRQEKAGAYPLLDFSSRDVLRKRVEQLARRLLLPENLVAQQAVELSAKEIEQAWAKRATMNDDVESLKEVEELPRNVFAAYYLLEPDGVQKLRNALKICSTSRNLLETVILRRPSVTYFATLTALFVVALLGFALWIANGTGFTISQLSILFLALSLPVSEWVVSAAHWLIECVRQPRPLLRCDFSRGIPIEATTMVVVPVIWSSVNEVKELTDRLELHCLSNRDPNIHFAFLGDFIDADAERISKDSAVIVAARASIEALNNRYSHLGGSTFHLFQRRRLWNPSEGVWMGWERKRGKLVEFVELLKGKTNTTYDFVVGDATVLPRIRYIITLDADTQLPIGSAQRIIGTMHLPYNRPRLNQTRTRVVEGYGVLQPRIDISHSASLRSRFAYLWSQDPGIDPYIFAAADPYQDGVWGRVFSQVKVFSMSTYLRKFYVNGYQKTGFLVMTC